MKNSMLYGNFVFLALLLTIGCDERRLQVHDDHDSHSAAAHADHAPDAEESVHAHEGADADAHHHDEMEIEISPEFMHMAGITIATARTGRIKRIIAVSGEVGFNEDRLVQIKPRFPGIVKDVNYSVGEYVKAGDIVATIESDESMAPYTLKAPISGRIVEKYIGPGTHITEESIYLLADLSNVWVNLAVYPKDAQKVKAGQKFILHPADYDSIVESSIKYVAPVVDPHTRRITARAILSNATSVWRPGSFVNACITVGEGEAGVVIDKDAVQILKDKQVVFIPDEPGRFKPVEVIPGECDSVCVRILSGLETGTEYVNNGAFELKAQMVTSSMGEHAGHGH